VHPCSEHVAVLLWPPLASLMMHVTAAVEHLNKAAGAAAALNPLNGQRVARGVCYCTVAHMCQMHMLPTGGHVAGCS
jgi:hypothetical protein